MKGIYAILMQLDGASEIHANNRMFDLEKGFYVYIGSALSGLEKRVGRHLSSVKKCHWHIDYLLKAARIINIICAETTEGKECALARISSQRLPAIRGFGSSDCKCPSHLFFSKDPETIVNVINAAFKSLDLNPFIYLE
jgi:Uri superfamily endonuclease